MYREEINRSLDSEYSQSILCTPSDDPFPSSTLVMPTPSNKRLRTDPHHSDYEKSSHYGTVLPPIAAKNRHGSGGNYQNNYSMSTFSQDSKSYSQEVTNRFDGMNCFEDFENKSGNHHDHINNNNHGYKSNNYNHHNHNMNNHHNDSQKAPEPPTVLHSVVNTLLPGQQPSKSSKTTIWLGGAQDKPRFRWDFVDISDLGRGAHSSVFVARHRLDGSLYAIKRLNEYVKDFQPSFSDVKEVCANIALRGCPNLVQYFGSWIEDEHLWIQLELCLRINLDIFVTSDDIPQLKRAPSSAMILSDSYEEFCHGNDLDDSDENFFHNENECKSAPQEQVIRSCSGAAEFVVVFSEKTFWKVLHSISTALEFMHAKCKFFFLFFFLFSFL